MRAWLQASHGNRTTENYLHRIFVTLFKWARERGYLALDRKTAPERAMTFNGVESAPAAVKSALLVQFAIPANIPEAMLRHAELQTAS